MLRLLLLLFLKHTSGEPCTAWQSTLLVCWEAADHQFRVLLRGPNFIGTLCERDAEEPSAFGLHVGLF